MSHKKDCILFMGYSGYFSQAIIQALIAGLEIQIKDIEESRTIAKRLYVSFIELFQNIMKYSKKDYIDNNESEKILIEQNSESYYVTAINNIDNESLSKMEPILVDLNELNKDEITKKYNELRRSGENTHDNGGGIGLYQLARKSDGVSHEIERLENGLSRLSITVQISKLGEKK